MAVRLVQRSKADKMTGHISLVLVQVASGLMFVAKLKETLPATDIKDGEKDAYLYLLLEEKGTKASLTEYKMSDLAL